MQSFLKDAVQEGQPTRFSGNNFSYYYSSFGVYVTWELFRQMASLDKLQPGDINPC